MKNSKCRQDMGIARLALVAAMSLGGAGCRLPARETWARIQNHGLIPVLLTPRPPVPGESAPVYAGKPSSSSTQPSGVNPAPAAPDVTVPPYAEAVSGRPGYVFSPFTDGERQVDVRAFHADQTLRCPYTLKSFRVPSAALANLTPEVRDREDEPRVSPRPDSDSSSRQRALARARRERSAERHSIPDSPAPSVVEQVPMPEAPARLPEAPSPSVIPYATRVDGRPGFVHSPFAQKHQLVDVTGIAPGVEVKCPYTDKPFRVPTAEDQGADSFAAPSPSSPAPASDAGGNVPPPSPDAGGGAQPAPLPESPAVKEITPPRPGQ